ncbi:MAG: hypothetical protein KGZ92_09095 [Firmicutes bacterium]|nr:hypothetical protein [Dethiobacter sp.]MBS3889418.1 hypothetical protein [Bacillota bacterium]
MKKLVAFVGLLVIVLCATVSKNSLGHHYIYGEAGTQAAVIIPLVDPPPPPPGGPVRG